MVVVGEEKRRQFGRDRKHSKSYQVRKRVKPVNGGSTRPLSSPSLTAAAQTATCQRRSVNLASSGHNSAMQ